MESNDEVSEDPTREEVVRQLLATLVERSENKSFYTWVGPVLVGMNSYLGATAAAKDPTTSHHEAVEKLGQKAIEAAEAAGGSASVVCTGTSNSNYDTFHRVVAYLGYAKCNEEESSTGAIIQSALEVLDLLCGAPDEISSHHSDKRYHPVMVELHYNRMSDLIGAKVTAGLIERHTLTRHWVGPRLKIFDALTSAPLNTLKLLKLARYGTGFVYTSKERHPNGPAWWNSLRDFLHILRFDSNSSAFFFQVLSAVLILGNSHFVMTSPRIGPRVADPDLSDDLGALLMMSPGDVEDLLTMGCTSIEDAYRQADLLAQTLHAIVVNHVVSRANELMTSSVDPTHSVSVSYIPSLSKEHTCEAMCQNLLYELVYSFLCQTVDSSYAVDNAAYYSKAVIEALVLDSVDNVGVLKRIVEAGPPGITAAQLAVLVDSWSSLVDTDTVFEQVNPGLLTLYHSGAAVNYDVAELIKQRWRPERWQVLLRRSKNSVLNSCELSPGVCMSLPQDLSGAQQFFAKLLFSLNESVQPYLICCLDAPLPASEVGRGDEDEEMATLLSQLYESVLPLVLDAAFLTPLRDEIVKSNQKKLQKKREGQGLRASSVSGLGELSPLGRGFKLLGLPRTSARVSHSQSNIYQDYRSNVNLLQKVVGEGSPQGKGRNVNDAARTKVTKSPMFTLAGIKKSPTSATPRPSSTGSPANVYTRGLAWKEEKSKKLESRRSYFQNKEESKLYRGPSVCKKSLDMTQEYDPWPNLMSQHKNEPSEPALGPECTFKPELTPSKLRDSKKFRKPMEERWKVYEKQKQDHIKKLVEEQAHIEEEPYRHKISLTPKSEALAAARKKKLDDEIRRRSLSRDGSPSALEQVSSQHPFAKTGLTERRHTIRANSPRGPSPSHGVASPAWSNPQFILNASSEGVAVPVPIEAFRAESPSPPRGRSPSRVSERLSARLDRRHSNVNAHDRLHHNLTEDELDFLAQAHDFGPGTRRADVHSAMDQMKSGTITSTHELMQSAEMLRQENAARIEAMANSVPRRSQRVSPSPPRHSALADILGSLKS